jgi:hypothetical protein
LPQPGAENTTGLMSLTYMQFLSKSFGLFAGKLYGLSSDDNAFAHNFHSRFLNTGLTFNMVLGLFRSLPMAEESSSCPGTERSSR